MIPSTEQRNQRSTDIDQLDAAGVIALMNVEELGVLRAVEAASARLAEVAEWVAKAYAGGGRIVYIGAGTSGNVAAMDAAEMPATFGVACDRFLALTTAATVTAPGRTIGPEDDTTSAPAALDALAAGPADLVVALAASGSTPVVVAGLAHGRRRGCATVGIANNPGTPLLTAADLPILLDTGPEVVTGSTRLKAATAQKLALNRVSTTAMVLLGRVVSNLMVEVAPANAKLKARCIRIVSELTGADADEARAGLERHQWLVRPVLDEARP
ncbi:MAG: N-acetylmuramic acid 6-phosphate etherase [Acidimicrobiia bacterium]